MNREKLKKDWVGSRLRKLRLSRQFSQKKVAEHLDKTPQQVQKMECGINNISVARLLTILDFLGSSPCEFFESLYYPDDDLVKLMCEFSKLSDSKKKDALLLINSLQERNA